MLSNLLLAIIIGASILYLLFSGGEITLAKPSNDTLLSKLFKWRAAVEYNGVMFYVRIVGDAVIEDARSFALLEARKLRRDLRNPNSDAYLMHLDIYDEYTKEELSTVIQIAASKDIMQEYMKNNPLAPLTKNSNPTQEDLEEVEAEKETRQEEYVKTMQEYVENWRLGFEADLAKRDEDALRSIARKYRIDEVCEEAFSRVFESYIVASSVYTDPAYKNRAFTYDEYVELPKEVKDLLYNAYNNMNISTDNIKN